MLQTFDMLKAREKFLFAEFMLSEKPSIEYLEIMEIQFSAHKATH